MAEKVLAKIRKFKIEDINKILEIEEQSFPKTAYPKETFLNYANSFTDNFVVIETGKDIAGYIIFDMDGHIRSAAIKSAYRRKGFGKMLFMHALKCAKKRLWLEVRSKNSAAIEFYKKLGMKIIGKIPNYYECDDALIMVLSQKEWTKMRTSMKC
ncbi:MAG: ribosomal protein S18-alanine N-acetyltransferase [Deltaproteobacteria bacterium]|nr:ribosomal protein S18-alanine N-acetyltransferase [Deltaproteobacteria bacterium]MBW2021061.1 ribosomal protein S18-alanine N-acetyltransferase [Deltaproteobacteria bacterium]MBW2075713.1 ribosomal protein S18-alanine N-acetyltransferase [Deltaproteobacteria bacterium]